MRDRPQLYRQVRSGRLVQLHSKILEGRDGETSLLHRDLVVAHREVIEYVDAVRTGCGFAFDAGGNIFRRDAGVWNDGVLHVEHSTDDIAINGLAESARREAYDRDGAQAYENHCSQ